MMHPDDRVRILGKIQTCIKGESDRFLVERRMKRTDGVWQVLFNNGGIIAEAGRSKLVTGSDWKAK